jgi:hypothetical protein
MKSFSTVSGAGEQLSSSGGAEPSGERDGVPATLLPAPLLYRQHGSTAGKTAFNMNWAKNRKIKKKILGLFFTLWNCSILQILLNLPVLKAVLSHQDVFSPSLQHLQAADPYQVTTSIHTFNLNQVGREIHR